MTETTDPPEIDETSIRPRRGVSRRAVLRGGAAAGALGASGLLGAVGAGAVAGADAEDEPDGPASPGRVLGPGPVPVRLTVNGAERRLSVEPRVTLLDALRDRLELTGAKRVCDRGTCGSCTVLLDGLPVYACSVLAVEAEGAAVRTVESLGSPEDLHPLQAAFVAADAQQCGFCTPGFVMAAAALLEERPRPSEEEVARAFGGNFCRCGTYAGLRRAMAEVAGRDPDGGDGGDRGDGSSAPRRGGASRNETGSGR